MLTFGKFFKHGGHFEFLNFHQRCKNTKVFLSPLPLRDRAILSKFSTHRVSSQSTLAILQNVFDEITPPHFTKFYQHVYHDSMFLSGDTSRFAADFQFFNVLLLQGWHSAACPMFTYTQQCLQSTETLKCQWHIQDNLQMDRAIQLVQGFLN